MRAQRRIGRRVGNEHRLARLERALELRIAIEIDDEIADRRILVARDEANLVLLAGEEDRAAVEPERVAQLARDGLQDVDEMERRRDLLQDVDDGDEMVALALQLGYAAAQPRHFVIVRVSHRTPASATGAASVLACSAVDVASVEFALIHRPPRGAR